VIKTTKENVMAKKIILRGIISLFFAVPFAMVTSALVSADAALNDGTQTEDPDCQACHPAFYTSWLDSDHGQAMTDPAFTQAWQEQGEPSECLPCHTTGYDMATNTWKADGITCEACHGPIASQHPQEPMPSERAAAMCGQCHTQTVFEWQISQHRQADMDCVDCHGQHSTSLKTEDADQLCASCHRDRASTFAHSAHSQQGLTCAQCHLEPEEQVGSGHSTRDHSFLVKLSACNSCHAYEMHDSAEVHSDMASDVSTGMAAEVEEETQASGVSLDPGPVSPIYYALLSALIGMAFGLLLSPWIERWFRRVSVNVDDIQDYEGE
jgi:predicted CXXCH cytochrome family protein